MASRLRVLLHSAAPKADGGGVQNVVLGLARHLRAEGHDVVVAWPDGDGSPEDWRLDLTADVGRGGGPGPRTWLRAAGQGATLARRLGSWSPDVVNLHFPRGSSLYFAALARVMRFKLVLSFHNSDLHQASPALRRALPRLVRTADRVTAVSGDLAAAVGELAEGVRVETIPNGIEVGFWSRTSGPRDPLLAVAAGRLTGMKGFDVLLRAFRDGAPDGSRLVLAGEGEDRSTLETLAETLGLRDRVTFAGRLDREGMRHLYGSAGVFVMPSRREGFPLALLEAMSAGLPVVASSIGGVRDIMTEATGEMVPPDDPGALADALGRWLGDGDRLRKSGQAASARGAGFSEHACYAAYEALFREVRGG